MTMTYFLKRTFFMERGALLKRNTLDMNVSD